MGKTTYKLGGCKTTVRFVATRFPRGKDKVANV